MKKSLSLRKRITLWLALKKSEINLWRVITQACAGSRIHLFWSRLWIRKDEFHSTVSLDPIALMTMSQRKRVVYENDLIKRRNIAHNNDFKSANVRTIELQLIKRLNKSTDGDTPREIVRNFARELDVVHTCCLVPKSSDNLIEKIFIIFLGDHSFTLEYSGFFRKRWKLLK